MYIFSNSAEPHSEDSSKYEECDVFDSPKNDSDDYVPNWKIATDPEDGSYSETTHKRDLH